MDEGSQLQYRRSTRQRKLAKAQRNILFSDSAAVAWANKVTASIYQSALQQVHPLTMQRATKAKSAWPSFGGYIGAASKGKSKRIYIAPL